MQIIVRNKNKASRRPPLIQRKTKDIGQTNESLKLFMAYVENCKNLKESSADTLAEVFIHKLSQDEEMNELTFQSETHSDPEYPKETMAQSFAKKRTKIKKKLIDFFLDEKFMKRLQSDFNGMINYFRMTSLALNKSGWEWGYGYIDATDVRKDLIFDHEYRHFNFIANLDKVTDCYFDKDSVMELLYVFLWQDLYLISTKEKRKFLVVCKECANPYPFFKRNNSAKFCSDDCRHDANNLKKKISARKN